MKTAGKYLAISCFFLSQLCAGQDTIRYRSTSFHASVNDYLLLSPRHPQCAGTYPALLLSVRSSRTDSSYRVLRKLNFSILLGVSLSRYYFFDEQYFINIVDKSPYHVLSRHFWGGFGISYRTPLNGKWVYDLDVNPCIQIHVDRSEDSRTDTSGWISLNYYNVYQGVQLYAVNKLEYHGWAGFAPYLSLACSVPLTHHLTRDAAYDRALNTFAAQVFPGIGITYFLNSRRVTDAGERKAVKP